MNKSFEGPEADHEWEERLTAMANALPRELAPGRLLEERTVATLRKRGLLKKRTTMRVHPIWMAGSIAASVALFATGVVVGQWMGTRTTTQAITAMQQSEAMRTAAQVQMAGSEYVNALHALAQYADSTGNGVPTQGREVALTALHAAANEVIRIAPNDPIAAEILRGFQRIKQQGTIIDRREPQRQIMWF